MRRIGKMTGYGFKIKTRIRTSPVAAVPASDQTAADPAAARGAGHTRAGYAACWTGVNGPRGGFVFTFTALAIALLMVSTYAFALSISPPFTSAMTPDPLAEDQIYRSAIIGAGLAALRGEGLDMEYMNSTLTSLGSDLCLPYKIPSPLGVGRGRVLPASAPLNILVMAGTQPDSSTLCVRDLPEGSTVVLMDERSKIVGVGSSSPSASIRFSPPLMGSLLVYTPDSVTWSYRGIVSPSCRYHLSDGKIKAVPWSPPAGFQAALVYGVPQLSLIQALEGGRVVAEGVKDPGSESFSFGLVGMNPDGMAVRAPLAWLHGCFKGGEVYALR